LHEFPQKHVLNPGITGFKFPKKENPSIFMEGSVFVYTEGLFNHNLCLQLYMQITFHYFVTVAPVVLYVSVDFSF